MIVIADDITGAAEMAGIAFARDAEVRLVCGCSVCGCDTATHPITVIATSNIFLKMLCIAWSIIYI